MALLFEKARSSNVALSADSQKPQTPDNASAPLITVVGASGGVGLSTIALIMAMLAAEGGLETTLIEADLQFGDYAYWLGLDDTLPDLGAGRFVRPITLDERLRLYKAPAFPELADELADELAESIGRLRAGTELAIADAGSYWSGLTARLLLESDLFLLVVDQRPATVYAAVRAVELCARIGVPAARMAVVYNRWSSKASLSAAEVGRALGAGQVHCLPDGKTAVDKLVAGNSAKELIAAGNPLVKGVRELLAAALPRVGCAPSDGQRPKGGLFR